MSVRIFGIESSCDETAAAVVADGRRILSSIVSSQIDIHRKYGGVVPELASREHLRKIVPVVREALDQAKIALTDLDAVAVTQGPGLTGALPRRHDLGKIPRPRAKQAAHRGKPPQGPCPRRNSRSAPRRAPSANARRLPHRLRRPHCSLPCHVELIEWRREPHQI